MSGPTKGGELSAASLLYLLNICQTNRGIKAKLSLTFSTSLVHPVVKSKLRIYHTLVGNDVRVMSWSADFIAK